MTVRLTPAPVRKSVTVEASASKAFETFTDGFGRWWPSSHKIGKSPMTNAVIEPKAGGRWFEVGEDGSECDWGEVLAWEPPTRLLLAWRIGADWQYRQELLTEVEVRFIPIDQTTTRVELEHRLLENMGEAAEATRLRLDSEQGWGGILRGYAAAASSKAA